MKWEYKVQGVLVCACEDELNHLGEQGWELVVCMHASTVFKRPAPVPFVVPDNLGEEQNKF